MKNYPFTEEECATYMERAIDWVKSRNPEAKGQERDRLVKQELQKMHNGEENMYSYDAKLFCDLIWEGYYEVYI